MIQARFSRVVNLLKTVVESAGSIELAMRRPQLVLQFGVSEARRIDDGRYQRSRKVMIRKLQTRGLIQIKENKRGWRVVLTERGRDAFLQQQIIAAPMMEDGTQCLVMFDIPEDERATRKTLIGFLYRMSFLRLQKSVYICPFDLFEPLQQWLEMRGMAKWVKIYRAVPEPKYGRSAKKRISTKRT